MRRPAPRKPLVHPAARNQARRRVARVFVVSFVCAVVALALIGFVFGLLPLRLGGREANPALLTFVALGVAAGVTVAYCWALRDRHSRAATLSAHEGDWPY